MIKRLLNRLAETLNTLHMRLFAAPLEAYRGAIVTGTGFVFDPATQERHEFTLSGRPSQALLDKAHDAVFGRLGRMYPRMLGAITHPTAMRNTLANAVVDALDGGTGAGDLILQTGAAAEVATCPFSATAFGAAASGIATANALTDDTSAAGGTMAQFVAEDGDGTDIFLGAVATSGSDINFAAGVVVAAAATVGITSLTYTAPA